MISPKRSSGALILLWLCPCMCLPCLVAAAALQCSNASATGCALQSEMCSALISTSHTPIQVYQATGRMHALRVRWSKQCMLQLYCWHTVLQYHMLDGRSALQCTMVQHALRSPAHQAIARSDGSDSHDAMRTAGAQRRAGAHQRQPGRRWLHAQGRLLSHVPPPSRRQ